MTKDRIKHYIAIMRDQALNGQDALIRDTLRRMEAELSNPQAQEPIYIDTDPENPWSRSNR